MDGFLIFLTVFVTLISAICTAALVPIRQRSLRVEPRFFKRIKVPFPASLLFAGIGKDAEHKDVKSFGVIVPMFVLHVVGYLLTALTFAIVPVAYYRFGVETDILFVIPLGIAVLYVVVVVVTELLCVRFSRNRQQQEQPQAEEDADNNGLADGE